MSRRAWGAFAAVSVLWGLPYLFIKIADDGGMPPLDLAWSRIALGAVVLVAIAWRAIPRSLWPGKGCDAEKPAPGKGRGRPGHGPGRLWPWPGRPGMRGVEDP